MQKRTFRELITWLIIASPLWWTSGCYSYREVTNMDEARGHEMKIVTHGNNRYVFDEKWTEDSSGVLMGDAKVMHYDPHWEKWEAENMEQHVILNVDSLKTVYLYEPDKVFNIVILSVFVISAVVLVVGVLFRSDDWSLGEPPAGFPH